MIQQKNQDMKRIPFLRCGVKWCQRVSGVRLFCDPLDCSPPGSFAYGTSLERILERVVISYSRASSRPRDRTCISCVSCIGSKATWEARKRWFSTLNSACHHLFLKTFNQMFQSRTVVSKKLIMFLH